MGIVKFLKKFEAGCIQRRPGSGRPSKISAEIKEIVEEQMRADDEMMATRLRFILADSSPVPVDFGMDISW